MNLKTCLIVMALSPFMFCSAQDPFPRNSPLSWLRNRVFGSKQGEERFVRRVAVAVESLVALVNDPVVLRELRKYYASLVRSPEVAQLVESVRPSTRPTRRRGSTAKKSTTTTTTPFPSTISETTSTSELLASTTSGTTPAMTNSTRAAQNESSRPLDNVVNVHSHPVVQTTQKYRYYFDPELVVLHPASSSLRTRVRRHLNLVRLNDVENCVSFLVCEMSRYPLRYGPLGVKVERFFRYPMWDTGSSAAHYAAMARMGRRYGCRGRISSCRHPIGPLQNRYSFQYRNY